MKNLGSYAITFALLITLSASVAHAQAGAGVAPPSTAQPDKYPTISWTASTSAGVTYNVYRGTAPGGTKGRINASPIAGLTYKDTAAAFGTTNYYTVTAQYVSSGVESVQSNEVSATAIQGSPAPPTGVNAVVAMIINAVKTFLAGLRWMGTFGGRIA